MTRDDVADFVSEHRREFVIVGQFQERRRRIYMSARQREAVNLSALNHMKFIDQVRAQAGVRAALSDPFGSIQPNIRQVKFLRHFTMKLHPEFDFIVLVQ